MALALLTGTAMYTPMMQTEIRRVLPLAQVGTPTALALLTGAAMYTPMMQTEIGRVMPIAKVGTPTALALLTEQAALYTPMMQAEIGRVNLLRIAGMMNVLLEIERLTLMYMMKAEIKYMNNVVKQCFLMVMKILGSIKAVTTPTQTEIKALIPAN